jgi:hypothetical protein
MITENVGRVMRVGWFLALATLVAAVFAALWISKTEVATGAHATGSANRVAIPNVGSGLPHDQVVVVTRTGTGAGGALIPQDISVCDSYILNAATYGVVIGQGSETLQKLHWQSRPGSGDRYSAFSFLASCTWGSTTYYVYNVQLLN